MLELSDMPFFFRNQEWKSAPDGSGFVLGNSTESMAHTANELRSLFFDITKRVRISDPKAVLDPPSQRDLIDTHVKDAASLWSPLRIIVFLRGAGDVEHTALVGIEPVRHKIKAFYVN